MTANADPSSAAAAPGAADEPLLLSPLRWEEGAGTLRLLDQLKLPGAEVWGSYSDYLAVAEAIRAMVVRGAPAIGITAAFGVALGARQGADLDEVIRALGATRPTAVNLFWALARMQARIAALRAEGVPQAQMFAPLLAEAHAIWHEDIVMCRRMGEHGASLLPEGNVLTHCNAGGLATGGYGTAVGVIRSAFALGRVRGVFADETRPYLQGARLTAYELARCGLPVTLVCDNMAGYLMARGEVQSVIVGADRIAANGDVANKIGTYGLAVLAQAHGVPFFVAAPRSTLDLTLRSGESIPIEERSADEVTSLGGVRIAPLGVHARHPAFDVTPARLITAIITDAGVARAPYAESLAALVK